VCIHMCIYVHIFSSEISHLTADAMCEISDLLNVVIIREHICLYTYMGCACVCVYVCTCLCVYVCMFVSMSMSMSDNVYVYVHVFLYVYA
jgi:hypothetical protein